MKHNIYIYILIMGIVSYIIRVTPLTLIRGKITNKFLNSFLYYVPYVTLAVMTFPAIVEATNSPIAGWAALIVGIVLALITNGNLILVSGACCVTVFISEMIVNMI